MLPRSLPRRKTGMVQFIVYTLSPLPLPFIFMKGRGKGKEAITHKQPLCLTSCPLVSSTSQSVYHLIAQGFVYASDF